MADPAWVDNVTPLNAANMTKLQTRDEKDADGGYVGLGPTGHAKLGGYMDVATDPAWPNAGIRFGQALDTNLYRGAAGVLRTDGHFWASAEILSLGSYIAANYGGAAQVAIGNQGPGGVAGVTFGADTNLYRDSAADLKTDGTFRTGSNLFAGGALVLGANVDSSVMLTRRAGNVVGMIGSYAMEGAKGFWGYQAYGPGDAEPSAYLRNDGAVLFGPGGAEPVDSWIYRSGVNKLRTDGTLDAFALTVNGVPVGGKPSQAGRASVLTDGAGHAVISFPTAFAATPVVVLTVVSNDGGSQGSPFIISVSTTAFQIDYFRAGMNCTINWIAFTP